MAAGISGRIANPSGRRRSRTKTKSDEDKVGRRQKRDFEEIVNINCKYYDTGVRTHNK